MYQPIQVGEYMILEDHGFCDPRNPDRDVTKIMVGKTLLEPDLRIGCKLLSRDECFERFEDLFEVDFVIEGEALVMISTSPRFLINIIELVKTF